MTSKQEEISLEAKAAEAESVEVKPEVSEKDLKANSSIEEKLKAQSSEKVPEAYSKWEWAQENKPEPKASTNPKKVAKANQSKVAVMREAHAVSIENTIKLLSDEKALDKLSKEKSFSLVYTAVSWNVRLQHEKVWVVVLNRDNPKFETEDFEIALQLLKTKKFKIAK